MQLFQWIQPSSYRVLLHDGRLMQTDSKISSELPRTAAEMTSILLAFSGFVISFSPAFTMGLCAFLATPKSHNISD